MAGKILVIEDNLATVNMLITRLEWAGYKVIAALDGETGLIKMKQEKPDVVLLDIRMPGMDGFEVCRKAKSDPALKKIPIIFLTTASQESDIKRGKEAGGDGYITKPYEGRALIEEVSKFIKPL